jgi:type I restriction enzyme S subunit
LILEQVELPDLPSSWAWTTVSAVYDVIGGGTPSTKVDEYWTGSIPWITSADIQGVKGIRVRKHITEDAIDNSATNLVPAGSLIVVTRVGLGKIAISETPICFSQDAQALIGNDSYIDPYYALYFLSQAIQVFKWRSRGTTISGVTTKQLRELEFALPPFSEQQRIVAKIEELLTNLDAGVQALKMVQAQIKRYRQAVLKHAFGGGLTAEWREAHKDELEPASVVLERIREERKKKLGGKYKEPPAVDTSNLPELPDGWAWASLEELSWDSGYGTSEKCGYEKSGIPVVRIPNIVGGEVNLNDLKYADPQVQVDDDQLLSLGDMLIIRTNGSRDLIGRAATLSKQLDERLFYASYLIRYRILDVESLISWMAHIWQCPQIRERIETFAATTAGQYNINIAKLNRLPIAVPPEEEQRYIISELDRLITISDAVKRNMPESVTKTDRLRQSILKKAFEGKLVPQDPSDEPADKLLERIKEERAKQAAGAENTKSRKRG